MRKISIAMQEYVQVRKSYSDAFFPSAIIVINWLFLERFFHNLGHLIICNTSFFITMYFLLKQIWIFMTDAKKIMFWK